MLLTLLNILFVINCFVLIVAILLQAGSGGGLGAGLSGGTQTTAVFGGRGPGAILAKITIGCATFFMAASLLLAFLSSKPQSVLDLTGEDQVVGNSEDEVVEEGTLDIKIKALDKNDTNVKLAPKKKAATKTPPAIKLKAPTPKVTPKVAPKTAPKVAPKTAPKTAPKAATKAAPKTTPKATPKAAPKAPAEN